MDNDKKGVYLENTRTICFPLSSILFYMALHPKHLRSQFIKLPHRHDLDFVPRSI